MENDGKETILIVDDVAANLEIISNILLPKYSVMAVKSGKRALEVMLGSMLPDLILLDVIMPDMNGFEVCRHIKADPRTGSVPVIFVSSQTEEIDEATGFAAGGVDYISKPVSPRIVLARVKTHLALSAANRELKMQNQHLQANMSLLEQIEQIARHDLKSPLTVFMGASDYMGHDKNLTADQLGFLKILHEAALKMLNMIDRSLDLFKMERGQYKVRPVSVDVVKLVHQACDELASLARANSVECLIVVNHDSSSYTGSYLIQSEENLLSAIVSNLVKNAIEASSAGEKVTITLFEQNPYLIEIRNQGVIPEEVRPRFFERYVTHGKKKGTGLGGYSARLAARTLGGDISFATSPETGTIITVSVPHQVPNLKTESENEGVKS
ncbi:MAG: hybrid sensor histidine kinase/response regulator [Candidatus Riflebacteria bacterium HGW-Riflebacteria-2]|jgi:CheY-like chemotaxis protein|nr:MAG: hybrid sensor histidine kinase/response regulator [Candidatus Riflebacteria bacterium HGW-Riflebacteria-2]